MSEIEEMSSALEAGDPDVGDAAPPTDDTPRTGEEPPTGERPRSRRRVVLWGSLAALVIAGALIAVLASSKTSGDSATSPLVGKHAPDISGAALNGAGSYSLSQYAGKWVLVNFAASWCVPCRAEMPQLQALYTDHATSPDTVILAVAFDEADKRNLAAYLKSQKASWPLVDDPNAEVDYGVTGIPESYLVDPEGTVVAKYVGGVTASQVDGFIAKVTGQG